MNGNGGEATSLESAIASVYAGPLEDFIRRRDALAKELRSSGRRDDAAAVKALRKPSRAAWALNAAAVDAEGAIEALIGAVAATLDAQASGGDVRAAIGELRAAVRRFAASAASLSAQSGHRVDEATLANGVLAVIGRPADFEALRDGRLVDVPEAGGLDFLASLPPPPAAPMRAARPPAQASQAPAQAAEQKDAVQKGAEQKGADARAAARSRRPAPSADQVAVEAAPLESLRRARAAVAAARARATVAQQKLGAIESRLASAEARLRQAEQEVVILRGERDRAAHDAEAVAAQVREAEQTIAEAERQL